MPPIFPVSVSYFHYRSQREGERESRKMKGSSRGVMGETLAMVVSLVLVLGLILVLLAELYCSFFLNRRRLRITSSTTAVAATAASPPQPSQPLHQSTIPFGALLYSQEALHHSHRSFLFPSVPTKDDDDKQELKNHFHSHTLQIQLEPSTTNTNPPRPPFKLHPIQELPLQASPSASDQENHVYISNPIFDNDESSPEGTAFETPGSSPSQLEMEGSSGGDDNGSPSSRSQETPSTPPLTPMKKLPAEACSVSLSAARLMGSSGSDSNSNNGASSSSSSGNLCTPPSW